MQPYKGPYALEILPSIVDPFATNGWSNGWSNGKRGLLSRLPILVGVEMVLWHGLNREILRIVETAESRKLCLRPTFLVFEYV
jgi:hypothetical protein